MQRAISEFIARPAYLACLLLVHPDVRVLAQTASTLGSTYGWPQISIGEVLSASLQNEPTASRPRVIRRWLTTRLGSLAPGPVLLCDIDLLYEPEWQLDPLALFRGASRTTRLVVAWPGTYAEGLLAYGVSEHSAYRTWLRPDVMIAALPEQNPGLLPSLPQGG